MITDIGKFYLYRHTRLDKNEPFYIGIGAKKIKQRDEYHRAHSRANRTKHWWNIIHISQYEVNILLESDDYEFIKKKEIEFIALYGRGDLGKGTLVNLTDGGEGCLGLKHSEETKKKISDCQRGKIMSEEQKLAISKTLKGRISPMKGRKQSPKFCEMIRRKSKGRVWSEESRRKLSESKKGKKVKESTYSWRYKKVDQFTEEGVFIKTWDSIRDASLFYTGKPDKKISTVCRTWTGNYPINDKNYNRKKYKGFIWKYHQN